MKVDILASGSRGNCIALSSGTKTILIDVGVAKTKIEKRLLEVGIRPDQVVAIFITHAHGDHIKGVPLANKYKIPIYAGEGEWSSIKGVDEELIHYVSSDQTVHVIDQFEIDAFPVHHDSYEPYGYAIYDSISKKQCSICLDTGKVDDNMLHFMGDSDYYIIEANHEPNMVEVSDYPVSTKARILSHIGHLSNEQTAEALKQLVRGRGEKIYLTHLSSKNNLPALAEMTVIRALDKKGFKQGTHYHLEVIE
ncbi:MBL fold metallo-hydrolase [Halalkalibacter krulwichiae]|uniref:Putative metallo-hydrolase YycJ n=1 Tax=Halalkalibacter krulwichiae TaxID=199441 RepID=A0A1X9MFH0_9BACI|nr:MBL fold metallo-hydrolase [Halalkalibacter krulwichiae]ARK32166.1 Putative metallo-hydrolase YycJ [Halalkalibacter krulwichiae]